MITSSEIHLDINFNILRISVIVKISDFLKCPLKGPSFVVKSIRMRV